MKITATTSFLHGRDRYEEGEEYEVDTALAGYFLGNGWATSDSRAARPLVADAEVSLDIQDGQIGVSSPEVSGG